MNTIIFTYNKHHQDMLRSGLTQYDTVITLSSSIDKLKCTIKLGTCPPLYLNLALELLYSSLLQDLGPIDLSFRVLIVKVTP
jgi:hypothetical protein